MSMRIAVITTFLVALAVVSGRRQLRFHGANAARGL